MEIRSCKLTDIERIYELICELEEQQFDYSKFKIVYENKLKNQRNNYYVSEIDNRIVGFISICIDYQLHHENKIATIEELVTDNNYRSQGIGRELVKTAKRVALENHCEVIELTSNFKRTRAHEFYENNGFIKTSYKLMIDFKEEVTDEI